MNTPPLHWSIEVHSVAHAPADFSFEATSHELEALKRYAEIEDIKSFNAKLEVMPLSGGRFRVKGRLYADAVQASVVNLSPVPASIDEEFSAEFWPEDLIEGADGQDVPFEEALPESIAGGQILIGEFLCELLSVSLNPYPRNDGDTLEWNVPQNEQEAGPFADLARLRQHKEPKER